MVKHLSVNGVQCWIYMEEKSFFSDFLSSHLRWGATPEEDSKVRTEEKEGAEFYESECSDYGEEKEVGVRAEEESSVQCLEKELLYVGGACIASSGVRNLKKVEGYTEMEGHNGCTGKRDVGRVYIEEEETQQYLEQLEKVTVIRKGREDGLICGGLPKAHLKEGS